MTLDKKVPISGIQPNPSIPLLAFRPASSPVRFVVQNPPKQIHFSSNMQKKYAAMFHKALGRVERDERCVAEVVEMVLRVVDKDSGE